MKGLFSALLIFLTVAVFGQPALQRTPGTTNLHMNLPSDGYVSFWNDTAKRWSNAPAPSGGLDPTNQVLVNLIGTVSDNVTNILERNKVYVRTNGSDSTGTRGRMDKPFLTPFAAKTAAVAGDVVVVGPGLYSSNNTNLLKGGVNWWFDEGAVLSNRVQQAGDDFWIGFFDDRFSGSVTSTIAGKGRFIWDMSDYDLGGINPNTLGALTLTNPASLVLFQAEKMDLFAQDIPNGGQGAFYIRNCRRFTIDLDEMECPQYGENDGILVGAMCLFWERGDVFGRIGKMKTEGYGVWCNTPLDNLGVTNDLYLSGDRWETTDQAVIYTSMSNSTHRSWFKVGELLTSYGGFSTISLYDGGRTYIEALKISARNQQTALLFDSAFPTVPGCEAWITVQKISSDHSWLINVTGTAWLDSQEYDDNGSTEVVKGFDLRGGHSHIRGIRAKSYANAVWHTGGTNYIDGLLIDSSAVANATNVPIALKANNLTLHNVSLLVTNTAANAINAASAQTLTIQGELSANRTNAIIDTDITPVEPTANVFSGITLLSVSTNSIIGLDANGKMRAVPIGANIAIAADGTLSSSGGGSIDTTPFALLLRGTNSWADGSNGVRNVYTNVFNSTPQGVTNIYWTNLADGQTLFTWVFPSNGVQVVFPQFATTDHLDGSTITPATNIWSVISVTRRGTSTNIFVNTATYALEAGSNVTFSTNHVTRVITVTAAGGSGTPAGTYDGQVQYFSNALFQADGGFFYDATADTLAVSNNTLTAGFLAQSTTFGVKLHPKGIYSIDSTPVLFGIGSSSNIQLSSTALVPTAAANAMNLGATDTPWSNLWVRAKVQFFQHHIDSATTLTNIDLSLGQLWATTNGMTVDAMYVLTNPVPGRFDIHLFGRTNSAANTTVTFTNAPGVTINWVGSGTNGPFSLTVFSNSVLKVRGSVSTNTIGTNILMTWESDSAWPQRNFPIIGAMGGSRSNFTAGGLIYYDYVPNAYTNHSGNQTFANANYTNLAFKFLDANALTNVGDSVKFVWRGQFRGANNGTNQLIGGIGTITNGLGDTGQFTNRANASWEYTAEVTAVGFTNHSIYWKFTLGGATTLTGSMTNGQYRDFATGILTNGVTNVVYLQCKGVGPGSISNDYFRVYYQGANLR